MQTFLPYKDFYRTAKCLDYKRLGKQRVEAHQIIMTLTGRSNGWIHHPIVKMWQGYEMALMVYFNIISHEWRNRGYKHNMGFFGIYRDEVKYPHWLGREEFHRSHRSNLLRKDYEYYKQFFMERNDLPYIWYK